MLTKDIKNQLTKNSRRTKPSKKKTLSTGSTLLNLAMNNNPTGGMIKGRYYFIVGDSASGKTFLSLTCLAEASINKHFKDYRFIYDNCEDGALMDIKKFFGKEVSRRMEPPEKAYAQSGPEASIFSSTIEDFYFHVDDAIKAGKPFIYILDSMDSLSSQAEKEKFDSNKKAHRKGRTMAGSYGDGKAKKNSANLRRLLTPLRKSKSILIVISQTRDNLGFGFEKKTRSGGRALNFYACVEVWSSIRQKIKKEVRGKKRVLGVICRLSIKKNRQTGHLANVDVPIYYSFGFDDTGSCVDYLVEEKHWKKKGGSINASEFNFKGNKEKLISHIENKGLRLILRNIVGEVWNEIEEECAIKRKKRYE